MIRREAAYEALRVRIGEHLSMVSLGCSVPDHGWTVTRQFRDFDDPKLPHPACCIVATSQAPVRPGPGNLHSWELRADAWIYFRNRDPQAVVDTMANAVIDAVDAALEPTAAEADGTGGVHTTLGGVVVRASIEGEIQIFQGLPESQSVVIIPIAMLVA